LDARKAEDAAKLDKKRKNKFEVLDLGIVRDDYDDDCNPEDYADEEPRQTANVDSDDSDGDDDDDGGSADENNTVKEKGAIEHENATNTTEV